MNKPAQKSFPKGTVASLNTDTTTDRWSSKNLARVPSLLLPARSANNSRARTRQIHPARFNPLIIKSDSEVEDGIATARTKRRCLAGPIIKAEEQEARA